MRDQIEEMITREIKYRLDEIDFDNILDEKKIKKLVNNEVEIYTKRKIGEMFELSLHKALLKYLPIIDAYTADKARQIINTIDEKLA